jgi:Fic family protein
MSTKDLLNQIDKLQAEINSHGKLDAEILKKINYKFRLDWNYNSNVMEGNSLTKMETRSVMVNNITVEGKPLKDVLDMRGHDEVITDILKIGKGELNISEKRIKEIHKGIIHEENPENKKLIGQWKTVNNFLTNYKNDKFEFTPYDEVPERMHELINWLSTEYEKIKKHSKDSIHPAQLSFEFHLRYITIHPFYDGNGRTARILTNLILIAFGYPPVIIKLKDKNIYYQYLADIQAYGGAPDLFYEFMSKLLIHSQEMVLDAIKGKNVDEEEDLDKKISLLKIEMANLDSSEDVQLQFNQQVFLNIYDSWLSTLIEDLIVTVRKFNEFFVSPAHFIQVRTNLLHDQGGFSETETIDGKQGQEIIKKLRESLLKNNRFIASDTNVGIHLMYGPFKKGALKKAFGCNYDLQIRFEYLKYSIYIQEFSTEDNNNPIVNENLKELLKVNKDVELVHFDETGNFHFNINKNPDGSYYAPSATEAGKHVNITSSWSREDILDGKILSGGLIRYKEARLLHKPLLPEEIKEICRLLGDILFQHIDYYTKQAGIR